MCENEAEKMAARAERNAKRRARRATLRALYEENAPSVSRYGSPLGRRGFGRLEVAYDVKRGVWDRNRLGRLRWSDEATVVIHRVPGRDGGDYDRCGTYWGGLRESPLFWVAAIDGDEVRSEIFIRAKSAAEIRGKLREYFDGIRFRSA